MPENYELEKSTHEAIRSTLFANIFSQLKHIELQRLTKSTHFFRFKNIELASGFSLSIPFDFLRFYLFRKELVQTQKWHIDRENGQSEYLVKIYHDKRKERYYAKIKPRSILGKFWHVYHNVLNSEE